MSVVAGNRDRPRNANTTRAPAMGTLVPSSSTRPDARALGLLTWAVAGDGAAAGRINAKTRPKSNIRLLFGHHFMAFRPRASLLLHQLAGCTKRRFRAHGSGSKRNRSVRRDAPMRRL